MKRQFDCYILLFLILCLVLPVQASTEMNCTNREMVIKKGKITTCGDFGGELFGVSKERMQEAQEKCQVNVMPDKPEMNPSQPGDRMTFTDFKCEISKIMTKVKDLNCYEQEYAASYTANHEPGLVWIDVESKLKVPGEKFDGDLEIWSGNFYESEQAYKHVKEICENAGGKIKSISTAIPVGQDGIWNPRLVFSTKATCGGTFYKYMQTGWKDKAVALCKSEDEKGRPAGYKFYDCKIDENKSKVLPISKEPNLEISVKITRSASYRKEDNDDFYKKWRCDRIAQCQANGDPSIAKVTGDVCLAIEDQINLGRIKTSDDATIVDTGRSVKPSGEETLKKDNSEDQTNRAIAK